MTDAWITFFSSSVGWSVCLASVRHFRLPSICSFYSVESWPLHEANHFKIWFSEMKKEEKEGEGMKRRKKKQRSWLRRWLFSCCKVANLLYIMNHDSRIKKIYLFLFRPGKNYVAYIQSCLNTEGPWENSRKILAARARKVVTCHW